MNLDPCWKQELLFHCRQLQLCLALLCSDFLPFASMFHFRLFSLPWMSHEREQQPQRRWMFSCVCHGILHAASTWDKSPPICSDTNLLAKKKKKNPTKLLNKLRSPGVLPFIKSQGNNSVYNRHPDCFTTSAWTKQNKCVERWPVSEGQNRYLVSYTVAMQPLVSSVTLVSVRSCSDGYSCMHVCTLRRTHFPILASEIVTLSQTSCTLAFAYRLPHIFHFSFFQAQQERLGGSRPCQTRPPSPLAWCWWKY